MNTGSYISHWYILTVSYVVACDAIAIFFQVRNLRLIKEKWENYRYSLSTSLVKLFIHWVRGRRKRESLVPIYWNDELLSVFQMLFPKFPTFVSLMTAVTKCRAHSTFIILTIIVKRGVKKTWYAEYSEATNLDFFFFFGQMSVK